MRRMAVGTEAKAVTALTAPETQYVACQRVQISMTCVKPHATMNAPKHRNIQLKGRSRLLRTKWMRVSEIETYDRNIKASETRCKPSKLRFHMYQYPCGMKSPE